MNSEQKLLFCAREWKNVASAIEGPLLAREGIFLLGDFAQTSSMVCAGHDGAWRIRRGRLTHRKRTKAGGTMNQRRMNA
jgi:hypothetical protein